MARTKFAAVLSTGEVVTRTSESRHYTHAVEVVGQRIENAIAWAVNTLESNRSLHSKAVAENSAYIDHYAKSIAQNIAYIEELNAKKEAGVTIVGTGYVAGWCGSYELALKKASSTANQGGGRGYVTNIVEAVTI